MIFSLSRVSVEIAKGTPHGRDRDRWGTGSSSRRGSSPSRYDPNTVIPLPDAYFNYWHINGVVGDGLTAIKEKSADKENINNLAFFPNLSMSWL